MTSEEAMSLARKLAESNEWPWRGEVRVWKSKKYWFFGPSHWNVYTNYLCRGCNIRIEIDDATQKVISAGFAPR